MMMQQWAESVVYQSERLFAWAAKLSAPSNLAHSPNFSRDLMRADELFYIVALYKSHKYLQLVPEASALLDTLHGVLKKQTITDMRDMLLHDDEYIDKRGHRQARFEFENQDNGVAGDATGTYVELGARQYLLGARINVFEIYDVYLKILPAIKTLFAQLISVD